MCPAAAASAQYSPICVEGVIGYAPAASLDSRSHMMTALLPSNAAREPGYLNLPPPSLPVALVLPAQA